MQKHYFIDTTTIRWLFRILYCLSFLFSFPNDLLQGRLLLRNIQDGLEERISPGRGGCPGKITQRAMKHPGTEWYPTVLTFRYARVQRQYATVLGD
jgi:hypothetical protein